MAIAARGPCRERPGPGLQASVPAKSVGAYGVGGSATTAAKCCLYAPSVARDSRWALASVAAGITVMVVLLAAASGLVSWPVASQDPSVIPLPTSELVSGMACNGALREGELVIHPDWGVALGGDDYPIFWPLGYVGRARNERIEILDPAGDVVARTGDVISVGGGGSAVDGVEGFAMCPEGPTVIRAGQP